MGILDQIYTYATAPQPADTVAVPRELLANILNHWQRGTPTFYPLQQEWLKKAHALLGDTP
jgi:hypothetical protein